jgi:N-hydroxyarylamine O-acetyltransferase
MYEGLYERLTNKEADAYLERIGLAKRPPMDREGLDAIVRAHQMSVPFENLDIVEGGREISLDVKALYDKVVLRRRGGYCFELNGALHALLSALGFRAKACLARVVSGRDYLPPAHHRCTIVQLGSREYFLDVGFGGAMPAAALEISFSGELSDGTESYAFSRGQGDWITLSSVRAHESEAVLSICTLDQDPVDFVNPNFFCSNAPGILFTTTRVVNIKKPGGHASILGDKFALRTGRRIEETKIASDGLFRELLEEHFSIRLD